MNRVRRSCPMLAALLALALAASGCGRGASEAQEESKAPADSGVVKLAEGAAAEAGITNAVAGPATIDVTVDLPGQVTADSSRVQILKPRFAGIAHVLRKQVGDAVGKGETVALVQSNESLTDYEVSAGNAGRVVARGVSAGEAVTTDTPLYTIVDLSHVWVEFPVYPHQLGVIRPGQRVHVKPESDAAGPTADATIDYVGPVMAQDTRVSNARVVLPNQPAHWEPGMFVTVTVVTDHASVAVAVPDEGVVRTDDGPAVFVAGKDGYRLQRVTTGRTDGRMTEIRSGLAPGTTVAARHAFVLKAEMLKAEEE